MFFFSAKAEAYKEDGNYAYKNKKFHDAIVAYTEGIKAKCNNVELNAILYTNRATAQWCLGKLSYWWSIILIHQVYFKVIDGKKKSTQSYSVDESSQCLITRSQIYDGSLT